MSAESICVVIPVYNMARYLFRCVASAIWQLEIEDEIIIIDDGSTDLDGYSELEPFKDRVQWLKNPSKMGISVSRNKAIRQTSAKWIKLLDADDILAPFALTCVQKSNPPLPEKVKLVTGACHRMKNGQYFDFLSKTEEGLKSILRVNPLLPSSVFIRRDALIEVGLFDEKVLYEEDWDMWLRLHQRYGLEAFHVSNVPICYYWYVQTEREQKVVDKMIDGITVREHFRRRYGADPA